MARLADTPAALGSYEERDMNLHVWVPGPRSEATMNDVGRGARSRARASAWFDGAEFSLHPVNVEEALGTLEGVARKLHAEGDRRAAFPDIYAIITRRVGERIELGRDRFFQEPQWISKLAGRFCRRYLDTLRWSFDKRTQDTNAW